MRDESDVRKCKTHGNTVFKRRKNGYFRCLECATEHSLKGRNTKKQKLVEYLGGECQICGYKACIGALEFHYRNPSTKSFGIAKVNYAYSLVRLKAEADKCALLCANCHREVHDGITLLTWRGKEFLMNNVKTTEKKHKNLEPNQCCEMWCFKINSINCHRNQKVNKRVNSG